MIFEAVPSFPSLALRGGIQGDVGKVLKLGSRRRGGLGTAQEGSPSSIKLFLELLKLGSGWGKKLFDMKLLQGTKFLVKSGNGVEVVMW